MDLILAHPWVLSANFHDGAVVASYPYDDYRPGEKQSGIHKTPDHQFFRHLASTYATNHETMLDQSVCTRQCGPLSLVEECRGLSLIGRECCWRQLSFAIKNQLVASIAPY